MYDMVWSVCDLANITGVDLETSFARKTAINKDREWPGPNGGG
jgi:hypothetical protein